MVTVTIINSKRKKVGERSEVGEKGHKEWACYMRIYTFW